MQFELITLDRLLRLWRASGVMKLIKPSVYLASFWRVTESNSVGVEFVAEHGEAYVGILRVASRNS